MYDVKDDRKRPIDYLPYNVNKAISEAWLVFHLDSILDELETWFKAALANPLGNYEKAEERESFFIFYDGLIRLVEASYFYCKVIDQERDAKWMASWTDQEREEHCKDSGPINLNEEQTKNPLPVFKEFCSLFCVEWIRIELWNFFEAARSSDGYFTVDLTDITWLYLVLSTLTEAAYIVTKTTPI